MAKPKRVSRAVDIMDSRPARILWDKLTPTERSWCFRNAGRIGDTTTSDKVVSDFWASVRRDLSQSFTELLQGGK